MPSSVHIVWTGISEHLLALQKVGKRIVGFKGEGDIVSQGRRL
jgi:hypothetical protein